MDTTLDSMAGEKCSLIYHKASGKHGTAEDVILASVSPFGVLLDLGHGAKAFFCWSSIVSIFFYGDDDNAGNDDASDNTEQLHSLWGDNHE